MARVFTRERLLNVSVNVIPLFIIGFFVVLFLAYMPWGVDPVETTVMLGLHVVPLVTLAVVSYLAVKHVEVDEPTEAEVEQRHREEEGAHAGESEEAGHEADEVAAADHEEEAAAVDEREQ
jgi:hypothetical protein